MRNKLNSILMASIVLSTISCTVVKSKKLNNESNSGKNLIYYYLPQKNIKLIVANTLEIDSKKNIKTLITQFKCITNNVADTRNIYAIEHLPNFLAKDDIKFETNSLGLLKTVDIKTKDETTTLFNEISNAFKDLAKASVMETKTIGETDNSVKKTIYAQVDTFEIKQNELSDLEFYKISKKMIIKDIAILPNDYVLYNYDFFIKLNKNETLNSSVALNNDVKINEFEGVLSRVVQNNNILIYKDKTDKEPEKLNVDLFNLNLNVVTPITRAAFVEKTTKLEIVDGMIISNNTTQPSSALGFISIPINIGKAIVSIPATLLQIKINNSKQTKDLEKEKQALEKLLIDNQKELANSKLELIKKIEELNKLLKDLKEAK